VNGTGGGRKLKKKNFFFSVAELDSHSFFVLFVSRLLEKKQVETGWSGKICTKNLYNLL